MPKIKDVRLILGSTEITKAYLGSTQVYPAVATSFLLDEISESSLAAYSMRKLRDAYAGPAVLAYRVSDGAETDIGFDANGDFDWSTYDSFIGASSGQVSRWYDQSGNGNHAEPLVGSFGSRPAITRDWPGSIATIEYGRNTTNRLVVSGITYTRFCISATVRYDVAPANNCCLIAKRVFGSNGNTFIFNAAATGNRIAWDQGTDRWDTGFLPVVNTNYQFIYNRPLNGTSREFYRNSAAVVTRSTNPDVTNTQIAQIGNDTSAGGRGLGGKMPELIIFSRELNGSDITVLKSNTQTYYGI